MAKYEIVPARPEHVLELGLNMRAADAQECWAAARLRPLEAASASVEGSPDPRAGLADGRVACLFGVGVRSVLSDHGIPWLLATDEMVRHARKFLRESRAYATEMFETYQVLENYVDARNREAVRWLGWLGFTIEPPEPFGVDQVLFHRFHREQSPCASS